MLHSTAVNLISAGILRTAQPQVWVDAGCGSGTFTKALADILPQASTLYAVDTDTRALELLFVEREDVIVKKVKHSLTTFSYPQDCDGVLFANSLHYVQDPFNVIRNVIRISGRVIIVEYDTDSPNQWVPYPFSFNTLTNQVKGDIHIRKIGNIPSAYRSSNLYAALLTT